MRLDLGALAADIADVQGRIKEAFYANLFLMMAESDRREITAREIDEQREQKMLMLGPVPRHACPLLQFHLGLITRRALP